MRTLIRFAKKIRMYGLRATIIIIHNRAVKKFYDFYWRFQSKKGPLNYQWHHITKRHAYNSSFIIFLESYRLKSLPFIHNANSNQMNENEIIEQADLYVKNCFSILGSTLQCFTQIPWHIDIRLQQQNATADCYFDPHTWYADSIIEANKGDVIKKDIKVPWELSRFQHAVILARAYVITKNDKYVTRLMDHMHDWLDHNDYLHGVNWVCPMEVALRAINWIIALELCKDASIIANDHWQRILCALYDHMIYLERTWEWYDGRTSNHYLSDLVGYFYLCWLFDDLPGVKNKRNYCYKKLMQEYKKQVFDEGTSYEGSTAYHRLVAELWQHVHWLCKHFALPFDDAKLMRMQQFTALASCNNQLMLIGDHDSGFVSYLDLSIPVQAVVQGIHHFSHFGISFIKTEQWHISLRHHAYTQAQPTGHFHNDWGQITLAYNTIPLFIDSGTYLYTPSLYWRNYYRSVKAHSTVFVENSEPIALSNNAFALSIPEKKIEMNSTTDQNYFTLSTHHDLYAHKGIRMCRTIRLDETEKQLTINDHMPIIDQTKYQLPFNMIWHFIIAPEIDVSNHNNSWYFSHAGNPLCFLSSNDLTFSLENHYVAPRYGEHKKTVLLSAISEHTDGAKSITITFN